MQLRIFRNQIFFVMYRYLFVWVVLTLMVSSCKESTSNKNERAQDATQDYAKDSTAIIAVIKGEYRAYFEKDYAAWASKFVQKDYLRYWGFWEGYPEKVRQYNNWKELDEDKKKRMAGEIKAYWDESAGMDMRNINLQIRGDVAWITFTSISKDQKTGAFLGESLETKILERVDGSWKIAYLNFLYLPMEGK